MFWTVPQCRSTEAFYELSLNGKLVYYTDFVNGMLSYLVVLAGKFLVPTQ